VRLRTATTLAPGRITEAGMNTITGKDGAQINYKDWGQGQPVVCSHG
jgi:hypothetical protein